MKKTSTPKKKTTAKAAKKPPSRKDKGSWADVMKNALQNKQAPGGFPSQPKPRDSGVQKVKKNAF